MWVAFAIVFGISMWASFKVKSAYNKYARVDAGSGMTGARAAARILDAAGIEDVEIVEQDGMLGDHYDPLHKRLVLSTDNFHGHSASALGVAAHETGHAIQHKIAYAPLQWRMAAVGVTTFANQAITILWALGFLTGWAHTLISFDAYLWAMVILWGIIMLFNLVTLPVEFDASRRAVIILNDMRLVTTDEAAIGVRKVLNAAALTYVAAFLTSLLWFLRFLLPLLLGRRD
jgi:hypothetical protein